MYCPKCGTQNIDNVSFCRACGANLSLVPQALTGALPAPRPAEQADLDDRARRRRRRRERQPPSVEKAVKTFFMGVAFIFVALAAKTYAPAGAIWWFWMLIPAFSMIGGGIAEYARVKESQRTPPLAPPAYTPPHIAPGADAGELPPRPASVQYPPASVTENTTQLLDRDR